MELSGENIGSTEENTQEGVTAEKDAISCLDQYLSKYESEDDASFKEMLMKSSEVHKQKHAWLHEKEQEYALTSENKLSITDGSETHANRPAGLNSWTYTAKNSLMYVPEGVGSSALEAVQGATKTREIVHSNTRFPPQFVQKFQHTSKCDKTVQDKVGIDGKVFVEESPKVNGYGFLATPAIKPGAYIYYTICACILIEL